MSAITIIHGGRELGRIDLGEQSVFRIGRGEGADIVLDHPLISREHARLVLTPAGYIVEDLGTKNGVFVDGKRVTALHRLEDGDRLELSPFLLHYDAEGYVPVSDEVPTPKLLALLTEDDSGIALSPLERYVQALHRSDDEATVAPAPERLQKIRDQMQQQAAPRLRIDGRDTPPLNEGLSLIGWTAACDVRLPGNYRAAKPAVGIQRRGVELTVKRVDPRAVVHIDGVRLKDSAPLKHGTILRIGPIAIGVIVPGERGQA